MVGFDCEWPTDPVTRAPGKLSMIQIVFHKCIHIYSVGHLDALSESLVHVLYNSNIIKMGRAISNDLKKIERDFGVSCGGGYDVATFCKERGAIETKRIGLSEICARVLERFLPKDDTVRLSDWSAINLTDKQKKYAALDAWAGLQVYQKLKQNSVIGKRIHKPLIEGKIVLVHFIGIHFYLLTKLNILIGTHISYRPGSMSQTVAYGKISCQREMFNGKKVTKSQVIIMVKQVLLSSAIDYQGNSLSEYRH